MAGVGLPAVHHHAHEVVLVAAQQWLQARQRRVAATLLFCLNYKYKLGISVDKMIHNADSTTQKI